MTAMTMPMERWDEETREQEMSHVFTVAQICEKTRTKCDWNESIDRFAINTMKNYNLSTTDLETITISCFSNNI